MNKSKNVALAIGWFAAFSCAAGAADEIFVLGPLEKVALGGKELTVLGQTYVTAGKLASNSSQYELGAYVYIEGKRAANGRLVATRIQAPAARYVPGASEVFLAGTVSGLDAAGFVSIGDVLVSLNDCTSCFDVVVRIGDKLEVTGSQPAPLGPVLAHEVHLVLHGSATGSSQGAEVQGIQGTGKRTTRDAGTQGIQGTGTQGIQGTGTQGIQGTGTFGIQGTGTQGIQGTGTQGIQGTGTQGIQGTGTLGIQGTG